MEINLQKISGLSISLDEENLDLIFDGNFPFIEKSKRSLNDLRPYLKNPEAKNGPDPAYRIWRRAHLKKDDEKIRSAGLRYDLTLLPSGTIDGEFVKTAGHYHLPYPEIYEVLRGRAYFLIQSFEESAEKIKSVYLAEAGPGEKFVIPPGFGHNMINVFGEPLLTANLVSEKAEHDYEPYKNNHGACYYFLNGGNLIDIVKNPNYDSAPEIKKIRAREYPEFGLTKENPLYSLINNLQQLKFLNHPEEFEGEWRNW
ncbi:glucose-6-phosphate isomerase [Candidatus Azambacteria bacterium]|nr:glucose-6-phosphate isomerase [Candidatus Azambacteria bacterium]